MSKSNTKSSVASPAPDPRKQQFEWCSLLVVATLAAPTCRQSKLFGDAFKLVNQSLLALAKSFLGSVPSKDRRDELAEEALQIWYLKFLAKGFHSYLTQGNGRPFSPYAIRSLFNICMSLMRGQNRLSILSEMKDFSDPDSNPPKTAEMEEIRQAIQDAMKNLPPKIRKALEGTYWDDQPNREVAKKLKTKPRTVATRNHRGRQILKEDLQKRGYWPL